MSDMIKDGQHGYSRADAYVKPTDAQVLRKLEWFMDQKLALMMHFGIYSQIGIFESWPLSDGDADWSRRDVDWESDAHVFKEQYRNLNKSFNPVRIKPDDWAQFASDNGFRYLIFTTKHHDGFSLFDTALSDYKVTAPDCPFHQHRYADIVRHVFDAFRAKNLGIFAYFSKPDWACPWYWAPGMENPPAASRNPTYDPEAHPELWNQFVEFTHGQMMELVTRYGPLDALWLDGGQVNPQHKQDIRLGELARRARAVTPDLLFADRTVGGEYENFITPEQSIPDELIPVPWESCVTVGTGFSYRYDDTYKSPRTLTNMLCDVVCRGGNLALNIAPQPDGRLPAGAMRAVSGLGGWLRQNGDAIYQTRPTPPYESGSLGFTRRGDDVYVISRLQEGEILPARLFIPYGEDVSAVTHLSTGEPVAFNRTPSGLTLTLPETLAHTSPIAPAFRLEK